MTTGNLCSVNWLFLGRLLSRRSSFTDIALTAKWHGATIMPVQEISVIYWPGSHKVDYDSSKSAKGETLCVKFVRNILFYLQMFVLALILSRVVMVWTEIPSKVYEQYSLWHAYLETICLNLPHDSWVANVIIINTNSLLFFLIREHNYDRI